MLLSTLLPLFCLHTAAFAVPVAQILPSRQVGSGTLFGPITLPSIQVSNISITLFNFGDEVFDISSISIFGDINDAGECEQTGAGDAPPPPGSEVVLGPIVMPGSISVSNIAVTFFNFADEVFDISSISIFGDINDGVCPPS
ncbi:hypothetical protein FB567DRAFT_614872 [Paraphoma chrysanthemicola]|uniref:Uncharacterized protein n=1 Tax=Paraphoma chrysanthemicola TaxID=798071 RepID=A0A8K0QT40_9PLEO|nr:hypothetical protein FB567DRAFT_614872 [Paraphoma chrysanthemicola]